MKSKLFLLFAGVFIALVAACSSSAGQEAEPVPDAEGVSSARTLLLNGEFPLLKGPMSPDGLQIIFGTPDLGVGEHRVGFVVTSATGLVRAPAVTVLSKFFPGGDSRWTEKQTALAVFRPWPYGTRGLYTTRLSFDQPGRWGLEINVPDIAGSPRRAELSFEVEDAPSAPSVGSPAVRSKNKTFNDVDRLSQLSTGSLQDPDLYQLTIAEAAASGLPSVVVMASPAFCTNAVCGPQVEVLQELKDKYKGEANFIHVDLYDNPEEIQGDLSRAVLSPAVLEWNLPSTEWSFVLDTDGIVTARFESFATLEELEQALQQAL